MRATARLVMAGIALASMGAALLGACSSTDDSAAGNDGGDEFSVNTSFDAAYDGCATFTGNGTTCSAPSNYVCPPCDCVCAQGPEGLRWACIVEDTSSCGPPLAGGDDDGSTNGGDDDAPSTPDVGAPDANAPDTGVPDTSVPDTSVPPDANDSAAPVDDDASG